MLPVNGQLAAFHLLFTDCCVECTSVLYGYRHANTPCLGGATRAEEQGGGQCSSQAGGHAAYEWMCVVGVYA